MKRLIVFLFTAFIFSNNLSAEPYKVGVASWSGYPNSVKGFKDGLAKAGLKEVEHIEYIHGEIGASKTLQKKVAKSFASMGVDLVYSLTTPGTIIFKEEMPKDTPIVFSIVTYPADSGLIDSFEYSGNNLVGTSNYVPLSHYVSLLKLLVPSAKKVAIFHRKGEPNSTIQAASMQRLLEREGISVIKKEPENLMELKSMALELVGNIDVFMTTTDTLMQAKGEEYLVDISLEHGVPILSSNKSGVESGSSFGVVSDFYTLGKMAGLKAAKILAEKIPPTTIESELQNPPMFLVNTKSLEILGLPISKKARDIVTEFKSED